MKRTPLYDEHIKAGGRIVDFAGFQMPVQYSGIIAEHMAVRKSAGLFDVSHMGEISVSGPDARSFTDHLVPNAVSSLEPGSIIYSPMCHEHGGCVDDLLVYCMDKDKFLLVVNASNTDKDFEHVRSQTSGYNVTVENVSPDYAQLALQGPLAINILSMLVEIDLDELGFYKFEVCKVAGVEAILSRAGYTGEDGFEVYCPSESGPSVWQSLMQAGKSSGLVPCGLGARDTLRFENRLALYGHELDDETTPLSARLGWTIDWNSNFIGKTALLEQKEKGLNKKLVGFEMTAPGVPRQGYPLYSSGKQIGVVTSGCKAPYLGKFLGLGYVEPSFCKLKTQIEVEIRGRKVPAVVVKTPFYKKPPLSRLKSEEAQA